MEHIEYIVSAIGGVVSVLVAFGFARHKIVATLKIVKNLIVAMNAAIDSITRFAERNKSKFPKDEFNLKVINPVDRVSETAADLAKLYKCRGLEKRLRDLIK